MVQLWHILLIPVITLVNNEMSIMDSNEHNFDEVKDNLDYFLYSLIARIVLVFVVNLIEFYDETVKERDLVVFLSVFA